MIHKITKFENEVLVTPYNVVMEADKLIANEHKEEGTFAISSFWLDTQKLGEDGAVAPWAENLWGPLRHLLINLGIMLPKESEKISQNTFVLYLNCLFFRIGFKAKELA